MKTLGLIGGMSWNSTELYYRHINEYVAQALGGLHSAKLVMVSVDFAEIAALQAAQDWKNATQAMVASANQLKAAGAEAIVICTNTMHITAPAIQEQSGLPVLHIGDAVAEQLKGQKEVALLGTYYTMSLPFYAEYYRDTHGIHLAVPEEAEKKEISRIIYDELCRGEIKPGSREYYERVIEGLGRSSVILGCTEIGMLIKPEDMPGHSLIDSTRVHAEYAARYALA